MKRALSKIKKPSIYHYVDGLKIFGIHDCITGDVFGITGDVSGITGDVSDCELKTGDRENSINVLDLVK
jgi:hypothetical protein